MRDSWCSLRERLWFGRVHWILQTLYWIRQHHSAPHRPTIYIRMKPTQPQPTNNPTRHCDKKTPPQTIIVHHPHHYNEPRHLPHKQSLQHSSNHPTQREQPQRNPTTQHHHTQTKEPKIWTTIRLRDSIILLHLTILWHLLYSNLSRSIKLTRSKSAKD